MKIPMPDIELSPDLDKIRENRKRIDSHRELLRASLKALEGFSSANQAMCSHPEKVDHYDPGYAGGGYDYTECKLCGGQVTK